MTTQDKVLATLLPAGAIFMVLTIFDLAEARYDGMFFFVSMGCFLPAYVMSAFAYDEYPYSPNASIIRQMIVVISIVASVFLMIGIKNGA